MGVLKTIIIDPAKQTSTLVAQTAVSARNNRESVSRIYSIRMQQPSPHRESAAFTCNNRVRIENLKRSHATIESVLKT